ncbi:MAG: hypothetical protein EBU93_06250, partial [Chlamydiae bacterium]|nr:hypothetical protein [Chlamydiota bacterium]
PRRAMEILTAALLSEVDLTKKDQRQKIISEYAKQAGDRVGAGVLKKFIKEDLAKDKSEIAQLKKLYLQGNDASSQVDYDSDASYVTASSQGSRSSSRQRLGESSSANGGIHEGAFFATMVKGQNALANDKNR